MSDAEKTNVRFGARLRAWRTDRKLSILEISKRTGLPHANLSGVERGKRAASDDFLAKIAQVKEMEVSFDQLKAWQIMACAEPEQSTYLRQELERMENQAQG